MARHRFNGSAGHRVRGPDSTVSERIKLLTRATPWRQVATMPGNFNTQHPQGMVKIGDTFFVSSVEIETPTKRFAQPQGGYDRDTGEGFGVVESLAK